MYIYIYKVISLTRLVYRESIFTQVKESKSTSAKIRK